MRTAIQLAEAFESGYRVLASDPERRLIAAALRAFGGQPKRPDFEIVEVAAVAGEKPRFMVLVNGFQWGPPGSTPDASGAYPDTWPSRLEAEAAYREHSRRAP